MQTERSEVETALLLNKKRPDGMLLLFLISISLLFVAGATTLLWWQVAEGARKVNVSRAPLRLKGIWRTWEEKKKKAWSVSSNAENIRMCRSAVGRLAVASSIGDRPTAPLCVMTSDLVAPSEVT